jgi:hypothetical protein
LFYSPVNPGWQPNKLIQATKGIHF